jgi:microcystin-dependent protein
MQKKNFQLRIAGETIVAEPFLSEIRIFSFNFPPKSWALCNGQLLPINQNQALFSLLGTTYGGDGRVNFALPNLQGRVPIHQGEGHTLGEVGGTPTVTITQQTMPQHFHVLNASNQTGNSNNPSFQGTGHVLAQEPGNVYAPSFSPAAASLNPGSITNVGGSQPHDNMEPYLVLNFCIALQGIFPSQN